MKTICAWHPKYFGKEYVIQEGTGEVSHGVCKDCKVLLEKALDAFIEGTIEDHKIERDGNGKD